MYYHEELAFQLNGFPELLRVAELINRITSFPSLRNLPEPKFGLMTYSPSFPIAKCQTFLPKP